MPVVVAGVLACSCQAVPDAPLRVGTNVWPGYEPLYLARDLGAVSDRDVRLVTFPSAVSVSLAFRNGGIDVAALTGDEILSVAQTMPQLQIVLVTDFSNGGDALVGQATLKSLKDLKGARIGVESGAVGGYLFRRALRQAGLTPSDVSIVDTPWSRHVEAFSSGAVDAIVTFNPHRQALLDAGATVLFDSSMVKGEIFDALVARESTVRERPATLGRIVSAWMTGREHMRTHPADAAARMAQIESRYRPSFQTHLQGIELMDRTRNHQLLGGTSPGLTEVLSAVAANAPAPMMSPTPARHSVQLTDRFVP